MIVMSTQWVHKSVHRATVVIWPVEGAGGGQAGGSLKPGQARPRRLRQSWSLEMSSAEPEPPGPHVRRQWRPSGVAARSSVEVGRERNQTCLICLPFPDTLCDKRVKCFGEKFELSL